MNIQTGSTYKQLTTLAKLKGCTVTCDKLSPYIKTDCKGQYRPNENRIEVYYKDSEDIIPILAHEVGHLYDVELTPREYTLRPLYFEIRACAYALKFLRKYRAPEKLILRCQAISHVYLSTLGRRHSQHVCQSAATA